MGVRDGDAREEPEPDRLRGQREGAGNQRLRGDHGRDRRQQHQGVEQRRRRHGVEQLAVGDGRAAEHVGALPEIVGDECGKDHREPTDADRPRAEMPEVGVHRLAAGDDQHQGAEDQQRLAKSRVGEERQSERGVERHQDLRLARDLRDAESGDDDEPHDQNRPEEEADARGALELDGEQAGQQPDGDRHDIRREGGRGDVETFDRREHADRRRDHAVAEQKPGAEHQRPQENPRALVLVLVQQAVEREDAALAFVLGVEDEDRVLDRDDQRDRPDRQGNRADDVAGRRRDRGRPGKDLVDCVERRGADVAVDDAERADRQGGEPAARRMGRALLDRRRCGRDGVGSMRAPAVAHRRDLRERMRERPPFPPDSKRTPSPWWPGRGPGVNEGDQPESAIARVRARAPGRRRRRRPVVRAERRGGEDERRGDRNSAAAAQGRRAGISLSNMRLTE